MEKVDRFNCEEDIINKVCEHISMLRKAVCEDFRSVRQIFEENEQKLRRSVPAEHHSLLPSFKLVKDALNRARDAFLNTNSNHNNLSDVHIPKALAKNFLVCEDGEEEKMLIFATKTARQIVKTPGSYYADRFPSAPHPFTRLLTLHFDLHPKNKMPYTAPVVYILLSNNTEQTYVRLYSILKEKLEMNIRQFKSEYETAQLNAVKSVFPHVELSGCYLHYKTDVWENADRVRLLETREGRHVATLCAAVPLVAAGHVPAAWNHVANTSSKTRAITRFKRYYEKRWFPAMSPAMLSFAAQRQITTDALEEWHRRINDRIPEELSLYMFVYRLKTENQFWNRRIIHSLFHNVRNKCKPGDISFNKKYKKLLVKLKNSKLTVPAFLKKVILLQLPVEI